MPGGTPEAYKYIEDIVSKVAAQVGGRRRQQQQAIHCSRK